MKKIAFVALLAVSGLGNAFAQETHPTHWSYTGAEGAKHWSELQSEFATCKLGREQSPIDIRGAVKSASLPPLGLEYSAGAAEVLNNGHTMQVNLAEGGQVKLATGAYKLLQFHFHTPSEERINGKAYPLVAHLVHRNDAGQLAVVAVLFKEGKPNPVLAKIFDVMPAKAEEKSELAGGLDPAQLLPAKKTYYAFAGSLTTPPCSESVRWQVLKEPVQMSKAQLAQFRKRYPMNARPVQPLNGRTVEISGS
jgi:carbonic anhydrase